MKKINELDLPSIDASDYKGQTSLFNKIYFTETAAFQKALSRNCYYFLGEKGSGKTALAYLLETTSQTVPKKNVKIQSKLFSIGETQYSNFIKMKQKGKLDYSDYKTIWINILLYLVSDTIIEKNKGSNIFSKMLSGITGKFNDIKDAIEKYHSSHRMPELDCIMEITKTLTSSGAAGLDIDVASSEISSERTSETKMAQPEIKRALLDCEKAFKEGIVSLKLNSDILICLDGLDMRPSSVDKQEYQKCINGLSEAAKELNQEFFPKIKDTKGTIRIVLLLRPDIFNTLPIQNSNCAVIDNAVFLNWDTVSDPDRYKTEDLYKIINHYFSSQNNSKFNWENYFPKTAFEFLLKRSFHRPRDFFYAIKRLIQIKQRKGTDVPFTFDDLNSSEFKEDYSNYLLGEAKNYASYYLSSADFDIYISYFTYFEGKTEFNYAEFMKTFDRFRKDINKRQEKLENSEYLSHPDKFLQLLYDMNIIGFWEKNDNFCHWSYRERRETMIMPKITCNTNCKYEVHYGLVLALNLGSTKQ